MISRERLILPLSLGLAFIVLTMGGWWIYLIYILDSKLSLISDNNGFSVNISNMLIWEGGTFFILLLLLSLALIYLFLVERSKSKSLKIFLASMTHELKTPLASMKLQAEVIKEVTTDCDKERLNTLTSRLLSDAKGLEMQFDKILQLSKIELGGKTVTTPVNIQKFLENIIDSFKSEIHASIVTPSVNIEVDADELALLVVFRNLFENSIKHGKNGPISISFEKFDSQIKISYQDKNKFNGDIDKLGTMFYKHNSPKGSGIGLYLSKRIAEKLGGKLDITIKDNLLFTITLNIARGEIID